MMTDEYDHELRMVPLGAVVIPYCPCGWVGEGKTMSIWPAHWSDQYQEHLRGDTDCPHCR